jgi:hypothetical protein
VAFVQLLQVDDAGQLSVYLAPVHEVLAALVVVVLLLIIVLILEEIVLL